tara:strand:- start:111 stop:485 length:375 start_codon:yes stop_codon:yes gene_type:complete
VLFGEQMDKKADLSHIDQILIDWARHVRDFRENLGYSAQQWQKISLRLDFDQMLDASDSQVSAAVEAIITDLDLEQRKVIEHVYLGHRWPEIKEEVSDLLQDAQESVATRLRQRGFYVAEKNVA